LSQRQRGVDLPIGEHGDISEYVDIDADGEAKAGIDTCQILERVFELLLVSGLLSQVALKADVASRVMVVLIEGMSR